jgi:predicted metalloprotease
MANALRSSTGRIKATATAVAAALIVAACGVDQGVLTLSAAPTPDDVVIRTAPAPDIQNDPLTESGTTDVTSDTTPTSEAAPPAPTLPPIVEPELFVDLDIADVVDVGSDKPFRDYDVFIAAAVTDVEAFWARVFPEVYNEPFEPLSGGIFAGYPRRDNDIPGCGERTTSYEDLSQFVAFYCQLGDFMVYDDGDDSLLTALADEFGSAVMGIVLAHEYGHAIQDRNGALDRRLPTIITEQQADCFAGSWVGQAYNGQSEFLRLGDRDLRAGLIAMLEVRDPVGTDQFVSGGHGSAFDRVGAFQEGFVMGPARCAELIDDPLTLVPNEFQTQADFINEGNADYDCSRTASAECTPAYTFLADDLNEFWSLTVPGFATVTPNREASLDGVTCSDSTALIDLVNLCAISGQLFYDEPAILELYNQFGDFTLGYAYGISWAEAAQQTVGSALTGEARSLENDCLVGAWVEDITTGATRSAERASPVVSSPGDLDEAIQMAILVGDIGANVDVLGSPFEKIESFRAGVLGGLSACQSF